ncbi:hypothetical protein HWV62_23919 [Athelia sp. TMB]|nr:hypothetical protein HWV62_23919 [Athelia sp. TMB]
MMYFYVITNFGNIAAASDSIWSLKGLAVVQVVVIIAVQLLYLMRIWKLSRDILIDAKVASALLAALAVLCVLAFAIGILFIYEIGTISSAISVASFRWAIILAFSVTIFIDVCIATIMSTLLYRSRPGIQRTDSMLFTLIQYVIGTGALTSAASIVYVVLYIVKPNTFLYLAQEFSITRLYVVSFLAMMNARDALRERLNVPIELDINFSNAMQFTSPSTASPSSIEADLKGFKTAPETPAALSQPTSLADISGNQCTEEVTTVPRTAPGLDV